MNDPDEVFSPFDPYSFCSIDGFHEGPNYTWWMWTFHYSDQIVRQLYSHFLLRLPSMYFTRVPRIFRLAKFRHMDVKKLEVEGAGTSQALTFFHQLRTEFIDALLKEWKTLNLVSALLLS